MVIFYDYSIIRLNMPNLFAVYKPAGISSYDVIRQLKKVYPGEKIGHGGTLDPFAEGVLVIGVGRVATKKLGFFLNHSRKTYQATLRLGMVSTTDDPEGKLIACRGAEFPSLAAINAVIPSFVGEIWQIPPRFSALKIKGERAYDKARRGEQIIMSPRQVFIESIRCISYEPPAMVLEITCGSGTYIRSIARALGERFRTGAYLTRLIRTRVRVPDQAALDFTVEQAKKEISANYLDLSFELPRVIS